MKISVSYMKQHIQSSCKAKSICLLKQHCINFPYRRRLCMLRVNALYQILQSKQEINCQDNDDYNR
jgi:hypothetical protein